MKQKIFTLFLVLFSMVGMGNTAFAADITAIATGNWSATGTWDTGVVPSSADSVIIPNGITVTIDNANSTCHGVNVLSGGILVLSNNFYVCSININSGGVFKSSTASGSNKNLYWGALNTNVSYTSALTYTSQPGHFKITCNGQFGGTVQGTDDGIAIFLGELANSLTIEGSSTSTRYLGRLIANNGAEQPNSTDFHLNIKQNISIRPSTSANTMGISLRNNKKFVGSRTMTIYPGYTLTGGSYCQFHTNKAAPTQDEGNIVYNIYGTLDLATNNNDLALYLTSFSGSTQKLTMNLGDGTHYAALKLGRSNNHFMKYYSSQSIELNWNNAFSRVVFGHSGTMNQIQTGASYNGSAYIEDMTLFPDRIRNLCYENSNTGAGAVLLRKTIVTDTLYTYGYGYKMYAGLTADATARTVSPGKLFTYNNNAYKVTAVSSPLTTVTATTLSAAGTWSLGTTITDASGNSYYCDTIGLQVGHVSFSSTSPTNGALTSGAELTGAPIKVIGNVASTITSGQTARFSAAATIGGNVNNGAGILYFAKNSTITGSFTNGGTVSLTGDLSTGDLINNGSLPLASKTLTINGSLSGTGTIDATTGNLVFGGSSEQTLAASNLTSSVNNLTIKPGCQLSTSGDFTATTLNLQCNSSNGPATLKTTGTLTTTTATVQQYLTGSGATTPNTRFWYFTSPLTDATSNALDVTSADPVNKLWSFSEVSYGYSPITNTTTTLDQGRGYVARLGANKTVNFTGTTLNNGDIDLTIYRTGTELAKRGYNLVGNPYPSYLDIKTAFNHASTTGLESTIWYRSFNSGSNLMAFDTYNAVSGAGISLGSDAPALDKYIPPMQAFWVRAAADGVNGNLHLNNDMRSHQPTGNKLRSIAVDTVSVERIRLQITNGRGKDQALVGFYAQARDSFERYDSHKMYNENDSIPEIFTLAGKEEVAINGLALFNGRKDMKLGFKTRKPGRFTIKALEMLNLATDTKVLLKDNLLNTTQDLTETPEYSFTSDAASSTDRFTLSIVKAATGLSSAKEIGFEVRVQPNRQIEVALSGAAKARVGIYDLDGRTLYVQDIATPVCNLNKALNNGIYLVKVTANGQSYSKKVVVNP